MMEVLKNLAHRGLVNRYVEQDSPRDRRELTLEGIVVLEATNL
ncbi:MULTISPECIES: hypothetical protein [Nostocales]|nr:MULTISPECIES: hypothetical protein [Nostocales]